MIFQSIIGGSAFNASNAVFDRTEKAQEAFRDLTASKYQAKFNEIKAQGQQIQSSNKVEEFANNNQIDSNIGSKRDQFARDNNIKTDSPATAEKEFTEKRGRIQGTYETKSNSRAKEYDDTQDSITKEQKVRQDQIDQYEEDRIGNDFISTVGGKTKGLGRPAEKTNYDDEFGESLAKPYEPKVSVLNWETGKLDPLPKGEKITPKVFKTDGQYVDPKKK